MEKILIKLSRYSPKSLKKTSFILGETVKRHYKAPISKAKQKKFVQTRYQQSKERFCVFQYKTKIFVQVSSTKLAVKNLLRRGILSSSAGFRIKQ